jgi:ABC-2 type transport system permease protein
LSSTSIVLGKFLGLVLLLWLAVLSSVAMMSLLLLGTRADLGLILSNLLGLALLAAAFAALGLYLSALSRQPVVAAFGALALSVALWLLDMSSGTLRALSPIAHFQNLNSGLISTADLVYFIAFSAGFLLLTIHHLRRERGGH